MAIFVNYQLAARIKLDVHFEVRGFTALLGRSGAGKTSLLKALAGLLPASGTPWNGLPPEARPVGYLPQGSALFPHLTVLENAAFALRGQNRFQTAQKLLDDLGVGHLSARGGEKVSGGEAQRVALARALTRNPELLLLDEPTTSLDATTRDAVLSQLIDTISTRNIPALAATHDPAIAGQADWLVLLSDGQIIQQGKAGHVFANPATADAALLLGYQNIWQRAGETLAIRAEDIAIAASGTPAVITAIRNHGTDLKLHCAMPEPMIVLIKNPGTTGFHIGQTIHLVFPAEKLRILNRLPATEH